MKKNVDVLLDKEEAAMLGFSFRKELNGKSFYIKDGYGAVNNNFGANHNLEPNTAVVISLKEVIGANLMPVPTYQLLRGFCIGGSQRKQGNILTWNYNTLAECDTVFDEKGILGKKEAMYVLDIQGSGLFIRNPARMQTAVESGLLVDGGLQLYQEEIDTFLDLIQRKDNNGLGQVMGRVIYSGFYEEFLEFTRSRSFPSSLVDCPMNSYVILRPVEHASKEQIFGQGFDWQRTNSDLIISAGGESRLNDVLDRLQEEGRTFRICRSDYRTKNVGYLVSLGENTLITQSPINANVGNFVGVSPDALANYYFTRSR